MDSVGWLRSVGARHGRKALVVGTGSALVVLIAITMAKLVWLVVDGPAPLADSPAPQPVEPAAPAVRYTPAMAAGWNLFGAAGETASAETGGEAPATNLSLQLLGVFSTGDKRLAGAVIAQRGGEGELYRIGAALPGGATLEGVEATRVLLRRRGQVEALSFDKVEGGGGMVSPLAASTDGGGLHGLKDRLMAPPEDDDSSEVGDAASRTRSALGSLASDLRSNPDGVMNELGLRPAGGGNGYLVGEGPSADLLRSLGLRAGDVLMSVNGKSLGNVRNDARLVEEVKAGGEARVEIRRGTQTFTVNYPL